MDAGANPIRRAKASLNFQSRPRGLPTSLLGCLGVAYVSVYVAVVALGDMAGIAAQHRGADGPGFGQLFGSGLVRARRKIKVAAQNGDLAAVGFRSGRVFSCACQRFVP